MRFGFLGTYIQLNYAYGAYAQAVEELGSAFQDSLDDMMNTAGNPGGAPLVASRRASTPRASSRALRTPRRPTATLAMSSTIPPARSRRRLPRHPLPAAIATRIGPGMERTATR